MPVKVKAFGIGSHHRDQARQRPITRCHASDRTARGLPQRAAGNGACVAIGQHITGFDHLAIGKHDPGGAAPDNPDFGDMGVITKLSAMRCRQPGNRLRHSVHPAFDQPDPLGLQMRDQHQRRCRFIGRRAAIGGIAAIKLAQARIAEMLAKRRPQRLERVDRQHVAHPADAAGAKAQRQADRRRDRRVHVTAFERVPDALGLGAKAIPAARFCRPGKGGNGIAAARRIRP